MVYVTEVPSLLLVCLELDFGIECPWVSGLSAVPGAGQPQEEGEGAGRTGKLTNESHTPAQYKDAIESSYINIFICFFPAKKKENKWLLVIIYLRNQSQMGCHLLYYQKPHKFP